MKIYLDDIRTPLDKSWTVIRNYHDFVQAISQSFGYIEYISFDHYLGEEKTGYDCAKFLTGYCQNNNVVPPQCYVHSANPVGRENIIGHINCYLRFIEFPETAKWVNIEHL